MGYRKGYYKKDGTYVQGHYVNSRRKRKSNNNNDGCLGIFVSLLVGLIKIAGGSKK